MAEVDLVVDVNETDITMPSYIFWRNVGVPRVVEDEDDDVTMESGAAFVKTHRLVFASWQRMPSTAHEQA